jgi:hypothetical protein
MSGVLARLAKQARGETAEVQPRMTPRFAPAARGLRGTPADQEGSHTSWMLLAPEIGEESATDLPAIEPAAGERKGGGSRGTMRDRAQRSGGDGNSGEGETRDTRARSAESSSMPQTDSGIGKSRRIAGYEREGGGSGREHLMFAPREVGGEPDTPQRFSIEGDGGPRKPAALVKPLMKGDEVSQAKAPDESSALQPKRDESSDRPGRRGQAQSAAGIGQRDASRSPRRLPEDVAASREEKTEVHISIGNIELRAPRAEARPQPAPFRPRVTLEEFLRRPPEERR